MRYSQSLSSAAQMHSHINTFNNKFSKNRSLPGSRQSCLFDAFRPQEPFHSSHNYRRHFCLASSLQDLQEFTELLLKHKKKKRKKKRGCHVNRDATVHTFTSLQPPDLWRERNGRKKILESLGILLKSCVKWRVPKKKGKRGSPAQELHPMCENTTVAASWSGPGRLSLDHGVTIDWTKKKKLRPIST